MSAPRPSHALFELEMSDMSPARDHFFVVALTDGSTDDDFQQRRPDIMQSLRISLSDFPAQALWLQITSESFWDRWSKEHLSTLDTQTIDSATIWGHFAPDHPIQPLNYSLLSADDFDHLMANASCEMILCPASPMTPSSTRHEDRCIDNRRPREPPLRYTFRAPFADVGHPSPPQSPTTLRPFQTTFKFHKVKPTSEDPEPSPKVKKGRGEQCPTCGVTVASDIKRHMRRHLEEGEQEKLMIKCPYEGCDVSKMQKSNLKSHIRAQHTGEQIYCPDEAQCTFRTHDDASMLRHRKRYHGYQPYHKSSGSAASIPAWRGKKSFLSKEEKAQQLGVNDLDSLPAFRQPWKSNRINPKLLHRQPQSSYTFVAHSTTSYRDKADRAALLPSPILKLGSEARNPDAPRGLGNSPREGDEFFKHTKTVDRARPRGLSHPPPLSLKPIEPNPLPRKYSLSALLHPSNAPTHRIRPESIPPNMMEIEPPAVNTPSGSPSSYYTRYDMTNSPYAHGSDGSDGDSDGGSYGHEWVDLDDLPSDIEAKEQCDIRRASWPSHSPPPPPTPSSASFSPLAHARRSSVHDHASVSTFALDKKYIKCRYGSCNEKLPVNGPLVDEHWKTHHVPSEGDAGDAFHFRCEWVLHNGEECSSSAGGSTIPGIHALWRHAMFHYNAPIPCPLGCGRLLTYGSAESVSKHLQRCKNASRRD